jgi:hypothetical protein
MLDELEQKYKVITEKLQNKIYNHALSYRDTLTKTIELSQDKPNCVEMREPVDPTVNYSSNFRVER